ncbi:MAG: DUF4931 domain-containing protein [Xanthomonadaceae bacterium]|nr:DUF4931 domain-containing protein [Rhodospirillaceae bacterium]NIA17725.1 DUF4931 domain-containing protein [Xanthomonadaceae bacterium]
MQIKSEIRKAYFLNKYVIITPSRRKRPRDIKEQTFIKRISKCVFCPKNIEKDLVVKKFKKRGGSWEFLVLKNKFPALTLDNKRAYGYQEVIVETPDHIKVLAEFPISHFVKLLEVYIDRTKEVSKIKRIEYILIFKNEGSKAGASIIHDHSQVFSTDILPPDVYEELKLAKKYKLKNKSCPYCDIIKQEMKTERKIFEDKNVAVFAPYASEYHYETWIFPKRHLDNITKLNKNEIKSFAKALKLILSKLHKIGLSYNYFFHQVLSDNDQHFYLKIQPRDSIWAGVELGSGLVINSISPEQAAEFYKE